MFTLLMIILGQCVFAGIVVFVLRKLLDNELMKAALESFEACRISSEIKEITVRTASGVGDDFKSRLESIRQRKFSQASFNFQEDVALKGGVIIEAGESLLDFSLLSRLQNFWS